MKIFDIITYVVFSIAILIIVVIGGDYLIMANEL